jgi:hypothetical protein
VPCDGPQLDAEGPEREADALSNFDFGRFDGSLRIPVVLEELKFNVLNGLLRDGEAFYRELQK